MAKEKNNISAAENDYMLGMKYKDIAVKYGVTVNTVKSWKQRYGWSKKEKSVHTKNEKVCTQNERDAPIPKPDETEMAAEKTGNSVLSDKQRLFCLYYVKYRNKVKAYQKAYDCSYQNAHSHAYELWQNVAVKNEVERLLDEIHQDIHIDIMDLIQQQIDIAYADMNDFVDVSKGNVKIIKEFDGTIVKEIKETKDGISVKLYDKQKAIDFLKNNLPAGNSNKTADNMLALADILKCPAGNRSIEELEEKE